MNRLLEIIEQAKQAAIANGTFKLPTKRQLLIQAGLSGGYFNQTTESGRAAIKAYEEAEVCLVIRQHTPYVFAKLQAYEATAAELRQWKQIAADLRAENDRLILELQLFRQFEAEWMKMRRERDRFVQQQQEERSVA